MVLRRYGLAICAVAIAFLCTWTLHALLHATSESLFSLAILVSAWYGGLGPGIVAIVASLAAFESVLDHWHAVPVHPTSEVVSLASWAMVVVFTCSLQETLNFSKRRAQVNDRKRWESETQLNLALDAASMGIWDWDQSSDRIRWSEHHERLFGLAPGTFAGTYAAFLDRVHPDDRDRVAEALTAAQTARLELHQEFRVIWPDGSLHWIASRGRFFYDTNNRPARMIGVVIDITEHKQAEGVLQRSHLELERQIAERTAALSQANHILQEQIAERQQAEVALKQREQELQTLLNNTPDVIIRCDRQFRFVYVNPAVERSTGMPASFFLGRTSQEHGTPPDLCRLWDETMQQVFATAQEQVIEFAVPSAHGCRSFQSRVVPEFNPQGEVEHVLIVSRDITEIKQAETERLQLMWAKAAQAEAEIAQQRASFLAEVSAQLATSLDYRAMLQQVAYLMVPRLADYCIIFITEAETGQLRRVAAAHIDPDKIDTVLALEQHYCFDLHADHPVAQVVRTRQPICRTSLPADWTQAINAPSAYREALQSLQAHAYMIEPLVARDRTLGALLFALNDPRRNYSAEEIGLAAEVAHRAAIAIDNVRLYQEAQAAHAASEAASRTKDEFLAVLSHELRTPLNSILGWARLLNTRHLDPATVTRALETIERNARHQAQLVEDILDVSRMIQGKLRLHIVPTQLLNIVTAAVDVVQPAIAAKNIHLNLHLNTDTAEVAGDPDRLQQVVWNLLSNAVKFTPEGGQVTIALQEIAHQVQLEITDTGPGIAPEFLPYVFERFRQADSSTTREHGGLGLGLAIARHLTELHGGKIFALSPGVRQGSTFVVQLPLAQAPNYSTAPATHSLAPPPSPPS